MNINFLIVRNSAHTVDVSIKVEREISCCGDVFAFFSSFCIELNEFSWRNTFTLVDRVQFLWLLAPDVASARFDTPAKSWVPLLILSTLLFRIGLGLVKWNTFFIFCVPFLFVIAVGHAHLLPWVPLCIVAAIVTA